MAKKPSKAKPKRGVPMAAPRSRATSGVPQLDKILDGLFIGDNVIWYDDAGSLAPVFYKNFIATSLADNKPVIYVSFDRSPNNLLEKLGGLANNSNLTILDCFTYGKGAGSNIFLRFYEAEPEKERLCQILLVDSPGDMEKVMEVFYGIHEKLEGDVRFVFESLTGMQDLWNGEESILKFYTHSCPRLYELNTIAYWIAEKEAHTSRLKAHINQVAQVVIDLSVKRGKTSLSVVKAENRNLQTLDQPFPYWTKLQAEGIHKVFFESEKGSSGRIDLGQRLKDLRTRRGLSQTELARLVGVTPSNISQVESNLIYPSLPALIKIAEILGVEMSAFFHDADDIRHPIIFPAEENFEIQLSDLPRDSVRARRLTPIDFEVKAEPCIIEIPPGTKLNAHFFIFKGEEMGYLLSGELKIKTDSSLQTIRPGDLIYLTSEMPAGWVNSGEEPAKLLWIKIR